LKKRVDECFCENNLHLEWGKKDHSGTILWHVVPGVIDSPLLIRKDCSLTQRDAESAESAENTSTNSHRENRNFYQENIYYKDQWHRYQRSQQNQEQEVPQTSLGRGLISIENGAEGSIGFSASSALLPPPAPLSLSSYQRNEQLLLLFKAKYSVK
jgi:hypothetical protein